MAIQEGDILSTAISRYFVLVLKVCTNGCVVRTPFGVFFAYTDEILVVNPEGAKLHKEILIAENRKIDDTSRA